MTSVEPTGRAIAGWRSVAPASSPPAQLWAWASQEPVAGADRARALGTGHSFNSIADTTGDLISLAGLPPDFAVDPDRSRVTVSGAMTYGQLAPGTTKALGASG